MIFLIVYGICAVYAILWMWEDPNLLYHAMTKYRDLRNKGNGSHLNGLNRYYFDNPDMRLLLNLLTESQGRATSLRILALFDEDLHNDLRVPDIIFPNPPSQMYTRTTSKNVVSISEGLTELQQEEERYDLEVTFDHAPANETLLKQFHEMFLHYTIEISPETKTTSMIAVQNETNNMKFEKLDSMKNYAGSKVLKDLDPSKEYTIRIRTVADGIKLASRMEKFGPIVKHNSE